MTKKNLLLKLYNAESSEDLHNIIIADPILSDQENWKPYGGIQNNCGTFEGQQARPEAALVEKITNSIDALLIKECLQRNIKPEDVSNPELPKTMKDAISMFYGVLKGNWENTNEQERRKIAKNMQLVVTGSKQTPNIVIYDNGEGQNPENFEDTFLSLLRGNKMKIPFVQGKFNMGSTGAVVFCGEEKKYQLIVSRRNRVLGDSNEKVGFTVVRKHILSDEEERTMKSTWYEYLTIDGSIPYIDCDSLDLGLEDTNFVDGTIVKMFSYQLSPGCRSNATLDLWRELNSLLYEVSVPLLIVEQRQEYKGHSNTKLMLGNRTRISLDDRDKRYLAKSFEIVDISNFGAKIPIEVTVFKPDSNKEEFIRKRPVAFLMNGQVQGIENRTLISADLGLRQIRDYMLVCIDCTNINATARNELFMSSRDRMREGKYYEKLKNEIIVLLKNDDDLKNANQEFKGAIVRESKDDKELIENLFNTFKSNKDIKNLLSGMSGDFSFFNKHASSNGDKKTSSKEDKKKKNNIKKQLKRVPSIFKLIDGQVKDGKNYKAIHKGGRGILRFETDVEDEFLTRNEDTGSLEIRILDFGDTSHGGDGEYQPNTTKDIIKVQRSGPFNGEIKLTIEPDKDANVGDVIPISVDLISSAGTLEVVVFIKIEKEVSEQKNKQKPTKDESDLALPKGIRVFQEKDENEDTTTWSERNMTAESIIDLQIDDNSSVEAIFINMDSNLLKKLINQKGANVERVQKKYFASIYAHAIVLYATLLGYYSSENSGLDDSIKKEIKDNMDDTLKSIFQHYGGFLLAFDSELNSR